MTTLPTDAEQIVRLLVEVKQLSETLAKANRVHLHSQELKAENTRLREALQKAVDTLADVGKFLKIIGKVDAAMACKIAEIETRRTLAGEEGK